MKHKIITKTCKFCNKEFTSLYPKQLEYNVKAHELTCKQKIIEETNNLNLKEVDKKWQYKKLLIGSRIGLEIDTKIGQGLS